MTIFEKIINGEIPCYKIAETEDYLAFLDIFPLKEGHTLVIPKSTVDYIFDMEDEQLAGLHIFSKKVAQAMQKVLPCKRIGTAVIGLEVPHTHIHLIPINNVGDINFQNPKIQVAPDRMTEIAEQISAAYQA